MNYPSLFVRFSTLSMVSLYIVTYIYVLSGTQWTIPTAILVLVENIHSLCFCTSHGVQAARRAHTSTKVHSHNACSNIGQLLI